LIFHFLVESVIDVVVTEDVVPLSYTTIPQSAVTVLVCHAQVPATILSVLPTKAQFATEAVVSVVELAQSTLVLNPVQEEYFILSAVLAVAGQVANCTAEPSE
jgi:hypothetical protein